MAFYGYGDIIGPWYSEPSPFYSQQPLASAAEAEAVVVTAELTHGPRGGIPAGKDRPDRWRYYLFCRQQGTWPEMVTGFDRHQDLHGILRFCPERHVGADYPPTLLLHGDEDTDVPYERSVAMARALSSHGIPHQLLTIPGGEHGFDARVSRRCSPRCFRSLPGTFDQRISIRRRARRPCARGSNATVTSGPTRLSATAPRPDPSPPTV